MMAPGQPVMMQGPMMGQGQQMYGQNVMLNNMAMGVQQRFQQQQVNYTYLDPTQPQDRQL
jgi:hypothetical protein